MFSIKKLQHTYPGQTPLKFPDIHAKQSERWLLLGNSGSGKTTLLHVLGGLLNPSAGSVSVAGQDLAKLSGAALDRFRGQKIGIVFQQLHLIPSLTAEENVALVTEICDHPMSPLEALDMVGLKPRRHHFPSQMSGGEQQRVAIARAIAKRPGVLLCDEPTGALDVKTGVLVLEVIDRVNRDLGTTTAVITHNAAISAMADRVITMSDGRISDERSNQTKVRPADIQW